ncbi:hypothetical protein Pgy4_41939, partial [Pseudomonas savastanoi pv. glycinea str. race 4]
MDDDISVIFISLEKSTQQHESHDHEQHRPASG